MINFVKPGGKNCKIEVINLSIEECFDWPHEFVLKKAFYNFKADF